MARVLIWYLEKERSLESYIETFSNKYWLQFYLLECIQIFSLSFGVEKVIKIVWNFDFDLVITDLIYLK